MSSAIEVLKEIIKEEHKLVFYYTMRDNEVGKKSCNENIKAFEEALLALEEKDNAGKLLSCLTQENLNDLNKSERKAERLDELKVWLEKEIEIIETTQEEFGNKVFHEEIRKSILKEVLERVGEQK